MSGWHQTAEAALPFLANYPENLGSCRLFQFALGIAAAAWIEPDADSGLLAERLRPAPDELIDTYPVRRRINNPANDGRACVQPDAG